jgi:arsenite methyltransferase
MAGKRQKKASPGSSGESAAAPASSTSSVPASGIPDYGQDSPVRVRQMFGRGAWTLAGGLFVWYMNRVEYPGPATTLLFVFVVLAAVFFAAGAHMRWSSRVGKIALRDRLLDQLSLKGDEKVLDAGCGRGLMAIGAAKRLSSGKVTACDTWDTSARSGNSGDAARENAKLEGVADRVRVENTDMRELSYPGESFDVVICTSALHHLQDEQDRDQAVRELYRVTKPGGKILLFDIANTKRYEEILRESGASGVSVKSEGFLGCYPGRTITATK